MDRSRIAAAIWPWGTDTKEQMIQAAEDISKIGYKSFESLKYALYAFDLNLKDYKEVIDRYDIKPASFYFHLPERENEASIFENLDKELDMIAGLGVKRISLQATAGRPQVMDKGNLEYEIDIVSRFAERTKEYGIKTSIHPHFDTWVMYENEVDNILQNTSADVLSLAPDTAHLVMCHCDVYKIIERYGDRVHFTHLKDIKEIKGDASATQKVYGEFCELGQGCIDFARIFKLLMNHGYDGPLCEELDVAPISNVLSAKNNYDFLVKSYK